MIGLIPFEVIPHRSLWGFGVCVVLAVGPDRREEVVVLVLLDYFGEGGFLFLQLCCKGGGFVCVSYGFHVSEGVF